MPGKMMVTSVLAWLLRKQAKMPKNRKIFQKIYEKKFFGVEK